MVSTPEGVKYDSPNVPTTSKIVNKPSDRKSMCLFTNIFYIKQKTEKRRIVVAKSKHRPMKFGTRL